MPDLSLEQPEKIREWLDERIKSCHKIANEKLSPFTEGEMSAYQFVRYALFGEYCFIKSEDED
jgi:hypothetical protein